MSEYIFRDKREKQPKYETAQDLFDKAQRKTARYNLSARKGKSWWANMSPLERAVHAVKISRGKKKAAMIKTIKDDTPTGVCAGCKGDGVIIIKETLPNVVWLCVSCDKLYRLRMV